MYVLVVKIEKLYKKRIYAHF